MKTTRKLLLGMSALLLSGTMVFSAMLPSFQPSENISSASSGTTKGDVTDITGTIKTDLTEFFDTSTVQALPEAVTGDREISVILSVDADTVLDGYNALDTKLTVGEYAATREGRAITASIDRQTNALLRRLDNAGVKYETGSRYDTLLGGVEVTIRASAFDALCRAVKGKAGVMVGEEYAVCETQIVENTVNVYETGIFDSSESDYDGTGTVIAVLDTGLDYTHTAFDASRFTPDEDSDVITMETLNSVMGELDASTTSPGLTASNVYLSRKVPFAYDYADKDDDVAPIYNEHGTHVAGIMVGNDIDVRRDGIRGVAPNAQLAVMKTFSDKADGAKTSWIIAALEDCVKLKVDVINMSLGSAAGFSREVDEDQRYAIYDTIKEQGISLVAAASNDYNSTFGSEKNGNLGLTSNPDSATVGAPSTYDAALSVASISGVKTPYLVYNGQIVYFTEASDSAAKPKDFVNEILAEGVRQNIVSPMEDTHEFEYVIIDGIGSAQQFVPYADGSLKGKIALIKRGQTNFEEKASLAQQYGAVGCIIFNNVSGKISMNVGRLGDFPVCSLSQADGEMLQRGGNGKITISRKQKAGPFMSDFSSWGPTPDLRIKPEITAHGGDIYSSVPGGGYDRLSGTSMASPNQAGVTALVRQYVKDNFGFEDNDPATRREITATVNQIMMSTADIALNTNGLPFSVRKQGAGLANLEKSTHSPAYLETFERDADNVVMDKAKIELGDDPDKTGVYEMKFNIVNIGSTDLKFNVGAIVMTEGVSEILTYKGDTTVTEEGYLLDDADVTVTSAPNHSGNTVIVGAHSTDTVTLTVTLSSADKDYLDTSFKNGMYVEGYVTLEDGNGTSYDLSVPFLAFYGSWAAAPLFDLDYFATNADELDDSKETLEKTLPDAYATRPVGGLYNDYITYLGSFAYLQDPNSTNKISASRDHIALSNYVGSDDGAQGSVNSIASVQLGLLRGAKRMVATITDATTGEVIFEKEQLNRNKSYNYGGAIYGGSFDVDFNVADYDLKNNTKYIFRLTGYIDYKDGSVANNTFEFPFYTDFTAPIVTGVEYTYEYDRDTETNRLFANISIYDNHYVQAIFPGYITLEGRDEYGLHSFNRYAVPVIGGQNTTSVVQLELTDQLKEIMNGSYNGNSFVVQVTDYASNTSMFEIEIPDDIGKIEFEEEEIRISPNEIYNLKPVITPSQDKAWAESIQYTSSDEDIARVVNGKLIGIASGDVTLTATSNRNASVTTKVKVHVKSSEEPDFKKFDRPIAENFRLTGYYVNRVYYMVSTDERDLGADVAGYSVKFSSSGYSLKMFPSESVTIEYDLSGYFDDDEYRVEYISSNPAVAEVDQNTGRITAKNVDKDGNGLNTEKSTTVSVRLLMRNPTTGEYEATNTTRTIYITVKAPYETNGPYLLGYKGLGGTVVVPADLGITEIQQFAFSNWDLVPKDLSAGDEISEEDPYYSKQWFIGDNTITEIVLPEGIKTIGAYAFANLTALQKITLPSTLTKIQTGAFYGCTTLSSVIFNGGQNNLQFINQNAFEGCSSLVQFDFSSIVAIGDAAFRGTSLTDVSLPASTQSIGVSAFAENQYLKNVNIMADKVKVGASAFCYTGVTNMSINASVLPSELFAGCTSLSQLKIGKDVAVIGAYALTGTRITKLEVDGSNPYFEASSDGQYLLEKNSTKIALVVPSVTRLSVPTATEVGIGAFAAANRLTTVDLPKVTKIDDYAFAGCSNLNKTTFGNVESVGDYAFWATSINTLPTLTEGVEIGERAFAGTHLSTVSLPENAKVADYGFAQNNSLTSVEIKENSTLGEGAFFANFATSSVKIGDNVTVGSGAFSAIDSATLLEVLVASGTIQSLTLYMSPYLSALTELTIGDNVTIGASAFAGAGSGSYTIRGRVYGAELTSVTLGTGVTIGDQAFYCCHFLNDIDLSQVKHVGALAFSGRMPVYVDYPNVGLMLAGVTAFAPALTEVTLTGLDPEEESPLGMGAFSYATELTTVHLPETLTTISDMAFGACPALSDIDLSHVSTFGAQAFANDTALEAISVAENATFGDYAFAYCDHLAEVEGLDKAISFGSGSFLGIALKHADLTAAVSLGDFAFAESALTSVALGTSIAELGENPFSGCELGDFTNQAGETSFEAGSAAKVVDGVLYGSCPNGSVLVTYPMAKEGKSFTVGGDVVRIGAEAFLGSRLLSVELGRRVGSIGDRAFYGCANLAAVAFTSINAPILEEQYNSIVETDADENGIPLDIAWSVGYYPNGNERLGLNLVDFRVWNADSTCVLYGANFIAEIGTPEGREIHKNKTLVMVRPINGTGYENFLYEQYFDVVLDGPTAIGDDANRVIEMIAALPDTVSLDDRDMVEQIRALYEALPQDQKACVYNANLSKLEAAEGRIRALLAQETSPEPEPPQKPSLLWLYILLGVVGVAAVVAVLLVVLLRKKKNDPAEETEDNDDEIGDYDDYGDDETATEDRGDDETATEDRGDDETATEDRGDESETEEKSDEE